MDTSPLINIIGSLVSPEMLGHIHHLADPLLNLLGRTLSDCPPGFVEYLSYAGDWVYGLIRQISVSMGIDFVTLLETIYQANGWDFLANPPPSFLPEGTSICFRPAQVDLLNTIASKIGSPAICEGGGRECMKIISTPTAMSDFAQQLLTPNQIAGAQNPIGVTPEPILQAHDGSLIGAVITAGFVLAGTLALVIRETTQRRH